MSPIRVIVVSLFVAFGASTRAHAECPIQIPTVPIGNPGNAADTRAMNDGTTGYGSVAYTYYIASNEVTNAQYAAFLNAVAATDTNGLYEPDMATSFGGIIRSGASGSYTYAVVSGRANNPVNYVSFWDACRFANWLHNGQPAGAQDSSTTEDGAYTLTVTGIVNNTIVRNANWQWAVASENEWYKAAFHQPAAQGGDSDDYWLYPIQSNTISTTQANYNNVIGNTIPVGSYMPSYYGAFDMAGNLWEWNEGIMNIAGRCMKGGAFSSDPFNTAANIRSNNSPMINHRGHGFRVSTLAPPPAPICVGDLNGDNVVNTFDLTRFLGLFGTTVPTADPGDFNCDGSVNTADLTIFLGRFGGVC